jgi:hypothetical protein
VPEKSSVAASPTIAQKRNLDQILKAGGGAVTVECALSPPDSIRISVHDTGPALDLVCDKLKPWMKSFSAAWPSGRTYPQFMAGCHWIDAATGCSRATA